MLWWWCCLWARPPPKCSHTTPLLIESPNFNPCPLPFSPAPEPADPVDPRCQNTVQDFLQELVLKGEPYASTVRDVLQSFIKE